MSQSENTVAGIQPALFVFVSLPDKTTLLSNGMGTLITTTGTISCGPFTGSTFPVVGQADYIIQFEDNNQNKYAYSGCTCTAGSPMYAFLLGTKQLENETPVPAPVTGNAVGQVTVMMGYDTLLTGGSGSWNQADGSITCGVFTDDLPVYEGNGYNISFTQDSTGLSHNYDFCTCTASDQQSSFSLGQ